MSWREEEEEEEHRVEGLSHYYYYYYYWLVQVRHGLPTRVRGEGQEKIWSLQTTALDQAIDFLEQMDELPDAVRKAADPLDRLVRQRLEDITASPVDDYSALNVRQVGKALAGLDWLDLVKVRRIETETKNRKTVLDAIDAALDRLQKAAAA